MIKCIIIDDEPEAITILSAYIKETPELVLVNQSTKAVEMIDYLEKYEVDIVFLDINMPQISGIEFMQLIKQINPDINIILTSAYSEYAIQGFDNQVIDYLLKPVSFNRFLQAVQRAKLFYGKKSLKVDEDIKKFFFVKVDTKNKAIKINFEDILYIEGLKNYVSIYTGPERIIALLNMKDLEKLLPKDKFQRVHKSYIIPTDRIKSIEGNLICLNVGKGVIPIGITYKEAFIKFLNKNIIT